jgi:hypothetical protein
LKNIKGYQVIPASIRCAMKKRGWKYCSLPRASDTRGWALFAAQNANKVTFDCDNWKSCRICAWFMLQGHFSLNSHST